MPNIVLLFKLTVVSRHIPIGSVVSIISAYFRTTSVDIWHR